MSTTRAAGRLGLVLILLLYCILGVLFAVYTPSWQAPDEPAHYNYVRYLAEQGDFPVLHMGDYPHEYLEAIKTAGFPPGMPVGPIRYEFHQPPLYYALVAPVYFLTAGSLLALRLCSVLLGAGIVCLAYATGRRIFPGRPALALAAAAFVAFLPQHLATVSQVGNDVLAELLFAAALYLLVGWERGAGVSYQLSVVSCQLSGLGMGLLLGLILITKTTAYIALPLAAGVLAWRWRRTRTPLRRILCEGLAVLAPAALIALPWYGRNIWTYGWPDFLGLLRHDAIVIGQMRAAEYISQSGWAAYWRRAVEWTFKSFWGVFGWMAVWLDSRIYLALAILSGIGLGGHLLRTTYCVLRIPHPSPGETPTRSGGSQYSVRSTQSAIRLLAVSALLTFLTYAWYNTQFLQHQGRYLFTALIPIGLALAAGWDAAVRPGSGRWLAAGLALAGAGVAAWGLATGEGLPKWPVAMFATAAVAAGLLDLALSALSCGLPGARMKDEGGRMKHDLRRAEVHAGAGEGESTAHATVGGLAYRAVAGAALAFPYASLVVVALYALFGEIVRQLH